MEFRQKRKRTFSAFAGKEAYPHPGPAGMGVRFFCAETVFRYCSNSWDQSLGGRSLVWVS